MNKEAGIISRIVKTNQSQQDPNAGVIVTLITAHSTADVMECAEIVRKSHPDVVVMLLATTPIERSMFVCAIVPTERHATLFDWLEKSIESVCITDWRGPTVRITETGIASIRIKEISYANLTKDYDPEKLVDQVRTNAFSFLRAKGLYFDPPEEKEYTFDDLEDMV